MIILITYIVGFGEFSHIIAGAVEGCYAVLSGAAPLSALLLKFIPAAFLGNSVGGVLLVAALNHAQVVAGTNQDA